MLPALRYPTRVTLPEQGVQTKLFQLRSNVSVLHISAHLCLDFDLQSGPTSEFLLQERLVVPRRILTLGATYIRFLLCRRNDLLEPRSVLHFLPNARPRQVL